MKKVIFIVLFSLISFSVYAKDQICTNKEINPKVQLQENGSLKIVDQYIEEVTPEEFYRGDEEYIKRHKEMVKMGFEREKKRRLHVNIQFLKSCVATTEMEEYYKQYSSAAPDDEIPLTGEKGECIKLLFKAHNLMKQGNKEESGEMMKKAVSQCPNVMDYLEPSFRCDYRFKVFNTTFSPSTSKKYTSQVFSQFLKAPVTDFTGNRINRKTEMLPGETMWVELYIPGNATSWCVWVPK